MELSQQFFRILCANDESEVNDTSYYSEDLHEVLLRKAFNLYV